MLDIHQVIYRKIGIKIENVLSGIQRVLSTSPILMSLIATRRKVILQDVFFLSMNATDVFLP